jgi:hypothetical protein
MWVDTQKEEIIIIILALLRHICALPLVFLITHKGDPNRLPREMLGDLAPEWPSYSNGDT